MLTQADNEYLHLLKVVLTGSLYEESYWHYAAMPDKRELALTHPMRALRAFAKRKLLALARKQGLEVLRRDRVDEGARDEGKDWPFVGLTMAGSRRLDNITHCIVRVAESNVPGDLVECGVWRGGCAIFMKAVAHRLGLTDRNVWLADSFEGMPKPALPEDMGNTDYDLSASDQLRLSVDQVLAGFRKLGLLDDRVKILKGWFKDTLPSAPIEKIAVLRLDGDLYESTRDALQALYHKVAPGGFVIIDDYYAWPPCQHAVDEFRANSSIVSPIKQIDWTGVYWEVPCSSPDKLR